MLRNTVSKIIKSAVALNRRTVVAITRNVAPFTLGIGFATSVFCEPKYTHVAWDEECLEHEFLIRQATTINVNAATQLLTVTLVAIQDSSERLRNALTKEICLITQALEWGDDGTPPQHWDELVAVRGRLTDLNQNIITLLGYMDYAEKLATVAAEISYLSGNVAASDAICERIDHANRACNTQKQLTHELQQKSLEVQQQAIISSPQFEEKLKKKQNENKNKQTPKTEVQPP